MTELLKNIEHDLMHNITVDEIVDSGDVCEWVGDYVEEQMDNLDLDMDEEYELYNEGCMKVYAFFGAEDLCSDTPEWDAHWENLAN